MKLWIGRYQGNALVSDGRCYLKRNLIADAALGSFPKEAGLTRARDKFARLSGP